MKGWTPEKIFAGVARSVYGALKQGFYYLRISSYLEFPDLYRLKLKVWGIVSLSFAQKTTDLFFNGGGKMLMSVYVSSTFDEQSQFFDFTPIQSLLDLPDTTLLLEIGAKMDPVQSGWPVL